ncbi:MAG: UbiA family prenyltransferase [Candidatus Limnocylindrus sp.]
MGQGWRTLRALIRLTHPLPTLLNAIAAAALATVAGAPSRTAALVALTMRGVHTCMGATNDFIDRDRDAGRPEKPLARGQLPPRAALLVAAAGLTTGLAAAAQVSWLTLLLAALGALVGFTYNVWMKRTALSWLPFAVGVSVIPAFAWSTVSSVLPAPILTLSLVALPGGAALALQNSLADRVLDAERGMRSVAVRLGETRALGALVVLHAVTFTALLLTAPSSTSPLLLSVAGLLLVAGTAGSASLSRWTRQRAWEICAAALALAALSVALATAEGVG